jgi:hypothetical protein
MMRAKQMSLLRAAAGLMFVLLTLGGTRVAAQDSCKAINDAQDKVITTPTHIYNTMTAVPNSADKHTTETIYLSGATYVKVSGKWTRNTITAQQAIKREEENRKASKVSCQYLKDEIVNGDLAAVYSVHSERADMGVKSDGQIWISKSKGLPQKNELDITSGGSTNHLSTRYEYANVQAPPIG